MLTYVWITGLVLALLFGIAMIVSAVKTGAVFEVSIILFFIVFFFLLFVVIDVTGFFAGREITRINKTGELRLATIESVSETGVWFNNAPQLLMELQVHEKDGSSYPAKLKTVISLLYLSEIRPSRKIEVVRDRENHEKIVLKEPDFEQLQEAYRLEIEKKQ